jgi:hypothetical protein
MRQWPLVILKPRQIPHVDIAAAHRAFPKVLGLAQSRTADLSDGAARARFDYAGDFHLKFQSKQSSPRFAVASISHCLQGASNSVCVFDLLFGVGICEVGGVDL